MSEFPSYFLRGVVSPKNVDAHNVVSHEVFLPNKKTEYDRDDKGHETSINWEDDETVEEFTFRDRQISPNGVVRVQTTAIEDANNSPNFEVLRASISQLIYGERAELEDNPYHGNLVFSSEISNTVKRFLCSHLACQSTYLPRP